ncbi:dihydroorotase [Promicromonospora sp. Populi]|uniref:dihydroorotase n=1 Tax=Promicromonospora sp. Populi TaxID=3239420 RepID=UPI0034E30174
MSTPSSTTYVLRGVRPYGTDPVDVVLADGVIAALGTPGTVEVPDGAHEVQAEGSDGTSNDGTSSDGTGLVLLPGLVDLHTHLREPGREDAETVFSGTRAAAAGGFTAVHAMANTTPTQDTAGVVEQVYRLGQEAGWVDVYPVGAVTVGLGGEKLAELGAMADSAARVRVFSDDGKCVHDPVLMRRALEYVKAFDGVVAQHAQEPRLTEGAQMNEGVVSAQIGLTGWPAVAEESIIARDVLLAEHVGSRLHVCHLSTAGSVEIIRWAKGRGINVTAEVTPHHLVLTDDLARDYDPVFKVNPPLRTAKDVEAVRAGLADGTIDIVATDHAPHPVEDKDCEWSSAAFGMTGLETALSVVQQTMVDTGRMTWADVARVLSENPARIGRINGEPAGVQGGVQAGAHSGGHSGGHGRPIAVGEPANLTLVDPAATRTIDGRTQVTASANTPFGGMELPGRVVATFLRGRATVLDGTLVDSAKAGSTAHTLEGATR